MSALELGQVFYRVEVAGDLAAGDHVISLWADTAATGLDGSLQFTCHTPGGQHHFMGLIIPPGCWKVCYAALPARGTPMVMDKWVRDEQQQ